MEGDLSGVPRRIYKAGNSLVVALPAYLLGRAGGKVGDFIEWEFTEGGGLGARLVKGSDVKVQNDLAFKSIKDGEVDRTR